jgi:hypothetical protein
MNELSKATCSCGYPVHLAVDGVCPRCKPRKGVELKREGMDRAARSSSAELSFARNVARRIAIENGGLCDMDQVNDELDSYGIHLGPSAGSVFTGPEWEFTGRRLLSKRTKNHARELKIWKLRNKGE